MSYNKKIWANGDLIKEEHLNNIENGIYTAHDELEKANRKIEENTTDSNTSKQDISDIKTEIGTEELTTTAKNIKAAINEHDSQIKINKTNIENIRVRKFSPKFDRIIYFSMSTDLFGNYTSKTKSELLDEIKKIYNLGCDGVYLIVHLSINKNTNSLYITGENYSEIIRYIIDECKSIGLEIRAIKVHCEQSDDQLKLETINNTIGLDNFKTQYKTIITELINIVGKDINNFVIFNELPYMYANSSNESYSIEIVNYIQSYGYSVSISTADIEGLYLMGDNLKNNLDYFCLNFYPTITHNGFNTNLSDSINMVMDTGILNLIRYIKQYGKSFYISETGCLDFEESMSEPWYWTFNDMTPHNGYVQQIYLEVIFNLFNDLVDGVCYWWDLDSNLSSYIKKSTKGGDIIE